MVYRVAALMGSYHTDGTLARSLDLLLDGAREAGAEVRRIDLMERHIEFCRNCRQCMLAPGEVRGACVIEDDVAALLDELEDADAIVLAAPVNLGDVNARTRQLFERMVGYGYWPAGAPAPKLRRDEPGRRGAKPAALLTSSAAPSFLTRWFARPLKTLRRMATLLRARPVASLVVGLASFPEPRIGVRTERRLRNAGRRLIESSRIRAGERARPASRLQREGPGVARHRRDAARAGRSLQRGRRPADGRRPRVDAADGVR